jgi:hypothetical protein
MAVAVSARIAANTASINGFSIDRMSGLLSEAYETRHQRNCTAVVDQAAKNSIDFRRDRQARATRSGFPKRLARVLAVAKSVAIAPFLRPNE